MVQIFGENRVMLVSQQKVFDFIMSGAQDEECEQEQELDFQFDDDDVENALRNVRQIAAAANDTPLGKRRKSLGEKKRGPPQSEDAGN